MPVFDFACKKVCATIGAMEKKIISTNKAPAAVGAYSQAVVIDGMVYTAGQIGLDPVSGAIVGPDVESQTRRVLMNLEAVLAEAGGSFSDVVKSTIYIVDMHDFPKVNEIYAGCFTDHPPARSTVQVAGLPLGALVEIEMIAYIPEGPVSF